METTLKERALGLVAVHGRALIGITGAPGAGKSTFTQDLATRVRAHRVGVAVVPMDGFHLPQAELVERGVRDVMGRIDTFDAAGYLSLLRQLRDERDRTILAPGFDRSVEEPVPDAITIAPDVQLVIAEGNYLLDDEPPWPDVRATLHEVWFVDTADSVRRDRLVRRHEQFGKSATEAERWVERVDEANARRVQARRGRADLIVRPEPHRSSVVRRLGEPGDLGWVVMEHGQVYAEQFGWDADFEALVARIVALYATGHDAQREQAWIAEVDGERVGCIFCVADPDDPQSARLRILLVTPAGRGRGLGGRLVEACVQFARDAGYRTLTLWTNDVLMAAGHIYETAGFELVEEERHHSFGHDLVGQNWSLDLTVTPSGSVAPRSSASPH